MSEIWLRDLAVAFAELQPADETERGAIAALLGFGRPVAGWPAIAPAAPAHRQQRPDGRADLDTAGLPAIVMLPPPETLPAAPSLEPVEPDGVEPAVGRRRWFHRFRRRSGPRGGPSAGAHVLSPAGFELVDDAPDAPATLPRTDRALLGVPPPFEPLLAPRSAPAITQLLLARRTPDGPLDADAAVVLLARGRPVRALPRRTRRTLRFGAQVLVDRSDSMRLFARDQADLVHLARRLLGPARTEVGYFTGSPLRGVMARPVARRQRYRPPASGTRILLLSDFGTVPRLNCPPGAPRSEWEAFFRLCALGGARPVGLVPYPAAAAPAWLIGQAELVTWDRGTTATIVNAGVR